MYQRGLDMELQTLLQAHQSRADKTLHEGLSMAQVEGRLKAHHYHAGMSSKQRVTVQNRWRAGELQVGPS